MHTESERLTLRAVQLEELDILLKVRDFFEAENIRYVLCGGSMLGAVRHGGFIPWDDDIDVLVPRDDFEKLRNIVREKRPSLGGVVFHLPGDKGYIYPFIKAVNPNIIVDYGKPQDNNLWIDIFPLDHFPDNTFLHWLYVQRLLALERALSMGTYSDENMRERGYYDSFTRRMKMYLARLMYKLFGGYERISRRMDEIARNMDSKHKTSRHAGDGAWPNGMHDCFNVSWLFPPVRIKFEGHEVNIPNDYDSCLKKFYGDYMTIPPEGKRQTHYIKAYRVRS